MQQGAMPQGSYTLPRGYVAAMPSLVLPRNTIVACRGLRLNVGFLFIYRRYHYMLDNRVGITTNGRFNAVYTEFCLSVAHFLRSHQVDSLTYLQIRNKASNTFYPSVVCAIYQYRFAYHIAYKFVSIR